MGLCQGGHTTTGGCGIGASPVSPPGCCWTDPWDLPASSLRLGREGDAASVWHVVLEGQRRALAPCSGPVTVAPHARRMGRAW